MVIKREVAYGIVRGLSEFWNCEELQDFTVTVDDTKFGCHKFLLAACSGFFRDLFRSGKRETKCVNIDDISSETFQLILETIYTGWGILTNDNVINIWKAANQLQITFMVTECETFVLNSLSLENHAKYFYYGRMLNSKIVTETIWNFILKHCNYFFNSRYFLEISFDDVLSLIKSQDLETSTEDEVLKAILKWVEYKPDNDTYNDRRDNFQNGSEESNLSKTSDRKGDAKDSSCFYYQDLSHKRTTESQLKGDANYIKTVVACSNKVAYDTNASCNRKEKMEHAVNESNRRKQFLLDLVSSSRTHLVSQECLVMLSSHPLVIENKEIMDIFRKALLYHINIDARLGHWTSGTIHRNNSDNQNVAARVRNNSIEVFTFSKHCWRKYRCDRVCSNTIATLRLITFNGWLVCLYVQKDEEEDIYSGTESQLNICCMFDTVWHERKVPLTLTSIMFSVITFDNFIYILQRNKFWKFDPSSQSPPHKLPELPVDQPMCHVTVYDQRILAFFSLSPHFGIFETGVLSFHHSNNTWTRLNNIEGPADGMTSFTDDHSTYLLQSNGVMWKLVKPQSDIVDFEFVVKLWRSDWPLHGAVIFLDELYIYGIESQTIENDPQLLKSLDGFFKKIIHLQSGLTSMRDYTLSMFVPFLARRNVIGPEVNLKHDRFVRFEEVVRCCNT